MKASFTLALLMSFFLILAACGSENEAGEYEAYDPAQLGTTLPDTQGGSVEVFTSGGEKELYLYFTGVT
ncbi:hypothetical protein MM300_16665 [Evansella sp. LMS18]|jgi:hypothetical protein|uniref:hypothetical protein n=1 Tax=Evansella sp. LMS18 TaxID=2924033 RepID=UPI0020D1072E|nr:hypothetical protein [Evansella sp. LMS18]UTR09512.1 hypothetical protein MM300_16665 [Evansella sp. LMS18]